MRHWYRIHAQADEAAADIYLYDIIGQSWFEDGVSAKQFLEQMKALPDTITALRVHVNSPGGDPFDATAIHNLLRAQAQEKGRSVEVLIEGIAASAATIVTSAGDTVKIARNALMLVHKPYGMAVGNADDMLTMAEALETVESSIVASYRRHSSLSEDELRALMRAATWMDADEALANGFATEIMDPLPVAAHFDFRAVKALKALGPVPERFRARVAALVRAQEEDWKVGGAKDLTLDEERSWDADAADGRVRKWASSDGSGDKEKMDWKKYRRSQIVYDANNQENFEGYKLGFSDIVAGDLKAIRAGLIACRVVLQGGRGGVDLPDDVIEDAKKFVDGYLGEQDGKEEDNARAASPDEVLAAVEAAGLSTACARELIRAALPMRQVSDRIAATVREREQMAAREKEIRALCVMAKCPEMADGYIRGGMSTEAVKAQLTILTAKLDKAEIDAALLPDAGSRKPRLDITAIYAERNRLGKTKEG